ncbi:MAG TPA: DUF2330 domain-containing protein [Cyanobacteria bacterium UBA8156]|jgi:hypothetical protein|nr:DUF2330 domain-containing protein [Cyanobacteria bacterium UBA8156]
MKREWIGALVVALAIWAIAAPAEAFCGFYVAKADSQLFNRASQVIIAREGPRTVLTMANDYQGDVKDFALVVPVPVVLQKEQVNVGDRRIVERLDAFSAPRLVEYFDEDPCRPVYPASRELRMRAAAPSAAVNEAARDNALGVTIEAKFAVGEYDILILGARESDGLVTWLTQNGYKLPRGARELLQPYIRDRQKFFVARVNLKEAAKNGFTPLRPLQIALESPRFGLPIRLGMANAQQEQDLLVYLLTPKGRVETTNYRTVEIPTDREVPEFVQTEFAKVYPALFERAHRQNGRNAVFVEYAWDAGNCDPCAAAPPTPEELRQAGVFWLGGRRRPATVFVTRLHVRYGRDRFPEDLQFKETPNQTLFQGRYIIRHPFRGETACATGREYRQQTRARQEKEVQTLAQLTGWPVDSIRPKVDFLEAAKPTVAEPFWRKLWR